MKTNLLLPIAGNGQRFIDAGYTSPKPLIEINGKTILDRSLESVNIDNCNLIFINADLLFYIYLITFDYFFLHQAYWS